MRNLGMRFNEKNVLSVYGGDDLELQYALNLLDRCLEATPGRYTPSEERVIDGFIKWYQSINPRDPYACTNVAYSYVNLNTGINLLFLIGVPYEGCRGGRLSLSGGVLPVTERFD